MTTPTSPHRPRSARRRGPRPVRPAALLAGAGSLALAASLMLPGIETHSASASTMADGSPASLTADAVGYHGVPPTWVVDSRDGTGTAAVAWGAGEARVVSVTGRGGVPSSGVSAVVANVTVTGGSAASHLTVWPAGGARPTASTVNWPAGDTRANLALLPVSADGSVEVFNNAGSVHVIIDVVGWYDADSVEQPRLQTQVPTRVVDSRDGTGTAAVAWGSGEARVVSVTGRGGVPSSGVSAVVANVTVTGGSAASHLTVWPAGGARPTASTVNWPAGDTRANLALLPVSADGSVEVFNNAGSVDVIVDVVGWYEGAPLLSSSGGPSAVTAIGMQAAGPHRLADTRDGTGTEAAPLTAGDIRTVAVTGVGPVPPEGVSAIVATVTVTGTTAAGHLTAWAADRARPDTSNLNWPAGDTRANLVVIPVSADGRINLFTSSGSTHVIVDVVGWQLGPTLDIRPEGRGTISGTTTVRVVPRDLPAGPVELHLDDLEGPPLAVADGDPATFTIDTAALAPGDHLLVARAAGAVGTVVATHPVHVDNRSYDFSAVSATMQHKVDALPTPGNALHVSHHGTQVYEAGFGTFDGSTVMPIASATKWISGATIMRLVDQGLLRLDTPVGEVLPSFTGAKAGITLRQLLSFTSGLRPDVDCVGSVNVTLAACVDTIAGLPLRAAPGTQFRYGSSHLTVAARMAEVVTGKPWVQIVADEVTGPLGLSATTYWNASNPNPAGSLRSSLDDYQRFLRMVWNDGELDGVRYLSTAAVDQMQRDQTRGAVMAAASGIRLNQGSRYGLGQWVDLLDPATGAYEISSPGAFGFYPWIDRERDVYGVYAVYVPTDGVSGGGWDVKEQVRAVIDG